MTDRQELSVIDRTGRFLEFLAAVAREVQSRPIRDFRLHGDLLTPDDVPEHSQIRLGPRVLCAEGTRRAGLPGDLKVLSRTRHSDPTRLHRRSPRGFIEGASSFLRLRVNV